MLTSCMQDSTILATTRANGANAVLGQILADAAPEISARVLVEAEMNSAEDASIIDVFRDFLQLVVSQRDVRRRGTREDQRTAREVYKVSSTSRAALLSVAWADG